MMKVTPEEKEYIEAALKSGNVGNDNIINNVLIARLTGKTPLEVQSLYMDIYIDLQNIFRGLY